MFSSEYFCPIINFLPEKCQKFLELGGEGCCSSPPHPPPGPMRLPMLQSSGNYLLAVDGALIQILSKSHDIGVKRWGTIDKYQNGTLKVARKALYIGDIKLLYFALLCYAFSTKFQDKGMKRFDWGLKFSSNYCIRSSERKQPRRFHCFKTRREQFLIR